MDNTYNWRQTLMYHLYILECSDKTLYTGITTDLKRRVAEHGSEKLGAKYTCARRPVKLMHSRKFKDRSAALKEESRIKKMKRSEKLKLIKGHEKYPGYSQEKVRARKKRREKRT